jgi:hypothetical protein
MRIMYYFLLICFPTSAVLAQNDSSYIHIEIGYRLNLEQIRQDHSVAVADELSLLTAHVYPQELGQELTLQLNCRIKNRIQVGLAVGSAVWSESFVGEARTELPLSTGSNWTMTEHFNYTVVRYAGRSVYLKGGIMLAYNLLPLKSRITLSPTLRLSPDMLLYRAEDEKSTTTYEAWIEQYASTYEVHESTTTNASISSLKFDKEHRFKGLTLVAPSLGLRSEFALGKKMKWVFESGYRWTGYSRLSFYNFRQSMGSIYFSSAIAFKV